MPTLTDRILTEGRNFWQRVSGNFRSTLARDTTRASSSLSEYDLRDMMLAGTIYDSTRRGGGLKEVLKALGRPCNDETKYPIVNHVHAARIIVDFYANAFGGRLGNEIEIDPEYNGEPINKNLLPLIARIWRWSNLDTRCGELTSMAANQGTVGIRIKDQEGPPGRVFFELDDRRFIKQPELDSRGNVAYVRLEYDQVQYDANGNILSTVKVEETLSKDEFSLLHDGKEQLDDDRRENPLGICPYVLLRHETLPDSAFGRHAYAGSETNIHALNFALSQLDESIVAHVWPYIFSTSPAKAPTKITAGKYTMLHSQTREGMPNPTFDPMAPKLPFKDVVEVIAQRVDWLRERQPQMILNSLKMIGGVSGETLQQMLKPAEAESLRARMQIEDAVRRAVQIAISVGIHNRIPDFDLGTGTGTPEAAERAYGDGEGPEAFAFARRPALPPTVTQRTAQVTADYAETKARVEIVKAAKAAGLPTRAAYREAGYTPEEIDLMEAEARTQDVLPEEEPEAVPAGEP